MPGDRRIPGYGFSVQPLDPDGQEILDDRRIESVPSIDEEQGGFKKNYRRTHERKSYGEKWPTAEENKAERVPKKPVSVSVRPIMLTNATNSPTLESRVRGFIETVTTSGK